MQGWSARRLSVSKRHKSERHQLRVRARILGKHRCDHLAIWTVYCFNDVFLKIIIGCGQCNSRLAQSVDPLGLRKKSFGAIESFLQDRWSAWMSFSLITGPPYLNEVLCQFQIDLLLDEPTLKLLLEARCTVTALSALSNSNAYQLRCCGVSAMLDFTAFRRWEDCTEIPAVKGNVDVPALISYTYFQTSFHFITTSNQGMFSYSGCNQREWKRRKKKHSGGYLLPVNGSPPWRLEPRWSFQLAVSHSGCRRARRTCGHLLTSTLWRCDCCGTYRSFGSGSCPGCKHRDRWRARRRGCKLRTSYEKVFFFGHPAKSLPG